MNMNQENIREQILEFIFNCEFMIFQILFSK